MIDLAEWDQVPDAVKRDRIAAMSQEERNELQRALLERSGISDDQVHVMRTLLQAMDNATMASAKSPDMLLPAPGTTGATFCSVVYDQCAPLMKEMGIDIEERVFATVFAMGFEVGHEFHGLMQEKVSG